MMNEYKERLKILALQNAKMRLALLDISEMGNQYSPSAAHARRTLESIEKILLTKDFKQ